MPGAEASAAEGEAMWLFMNYPIFIDPNLTV